MRDNDYKFTVLCQNTKGISNADSYWFGFYKSRAGNLYTQVEEDSIENIDSGFTVSYQNYVLYPGETQYFYEGNKGHETAQVSPSIGWNDEPPYTSSGTRTEKWTAVKTGDSRNTVSAFNADIMKNKFAQILQGKKMEVELEVKNKFDET